MNLSLASKINKNMINIIKSYLIISEEQMNKNKELLIYNFFLATQFLTFQDDIMKVNTKACKLLTCDYCINCNNKAYYMSIMNMNNHYKIIFNGKIVCEICYNNYYVKNYIMTGIKSFVRNQI